MESNQDIQMNDADGPQDYQKNNLYIKHIPQQWGEKELRDNFQQFGIIKSLKIVENQIGKIGFVCYEDPNDKLNGIHQAKIALQMMNGQRVGWDANNCPIFLYVAYFKGKDFSQINNQSQNVENKRKTKLYVKNFPSHMKEENLKEIFIDSKEIKIVSYYAIVEFNSEEDALNALNSKKNMDIYDSKLHVEFYQERKQVQPKNNIQIQQIKPQKKQFIDWKTTAEFKFLKSLFLDDDELFINFPEEDLIQLLNEYGAEGTLKRMQEIKEEMESQRVNILKTDSLNIEDIISYDFELPNMTVFPQELWDKSSVKNKVNHQDYEEKYKFIIAKLITFKKIYQDQNEENILLLFQEYLQDAHLQKISSLREDFQYLQQENPSFHYIEIISFRNDFSNLSDQLLITFIEFFGDLQLIHEIISIVYQNSSNNSQVALKRQNSLYFWTNENIKNLLKISFKHAKSNVNAFDERKTIPLTEIQNLRKQYEENSFKALLQNKIEENQKWQVELEELKEIEDQYKKQANLLIFQAFNKDEQIQLEHIDIHGQVRQDALIIVKMKLYEAKQALLKGTLKPNFDQQNHIFTIVCGAGNHSQLGGPVLKNLVEDYLKQKKYDFHHVQQHGVHFVRLIKG